MSDATFRRTPLFARKLLGAALFLCLAQAHVAVANAAADLELQIGSVLEDWNREDAPGLSVAVAKDGEVLYSEAFGQADLARDIPVSRDTRFNAGSIAKQFTAASILMLEDAGLLSLEDYVGQYIEGLQERTADVTVEQLLYHTSGVRDFLSLMFLAGWHPDDVRTQDQALRLIRRQVDLNFDPGENFVYSNSNYVLLAEIVTAVTGQSFAAWMEENIFSPVGLNDTLIKDDHRLSVPNEAVSYRAAIGSNDYVVDPLLDSVVGSSNLMTTATDLVRWGSHLNQAEPNAMRLLDRLSRRPALPQEVDADYAAGVFVGEYRGLDTIHHGGTTSGYTSYLVILPEARLSIAVLANLNTILVERLAYQIADLLLLDVFSIPPLEESTDTGTKEEEDAFEEFTGLYHLENEMILSLQMVNGRPVLWLGSEVPHPLIADSDLTFRTLDHQTTITFSEEQPTSVRLLTTELPQGELSGRRIEPILLSQQEMRDYEGRYYSEELEAFYTIAGTPVGLTVDHLRSGTPFTLRPVGNDYFVEPRAPDLIVHFVRDRRGRVAELDISVQRARHIRFEKH